MNEREILLKADRNNEEISKNFEEISSRYAGKVIVVEDGEVIKSAETTEKLIEKLERLEKDFSALLIVTIPPKDEACIL